MGTTTQWIMDFWDRRIKECLEKLERNEEDQMAKRLWSVFTDDMEHCIETGSLQCHRHHIFGASNRNKSEKYGFVIPIVWYLHEFNKESIHANPNKGLDLKWKRKAQEYYEAHYGTREDFIREFGRSWI